MTKSFIWIVVILIVLVFVVWWFGLFGKINSFSFNGVDSLNSLKNLNSLKIAEKFGEPSLIKDDAKSIVNKISELPKKIIANTVEKFKESLIGSAKNEVGQVIDSFQQNLGLKVVGAINEKPLTISLSTTVNKPIYFLIDGSSGEGVYAIDWGDGEQTNGTIKIGEKKTIDHAWRTKEIYLINAVISNESNEARRFSFPINIQ